MGTDLRRAIELMEKGDWQAAHKIVQEDEDSRLAREYMLKTSMIASLRKYECV